MLQYDPTLIFDLGLNTGQDAEFYLRKGFSVVGVEANPEVARLARERLKRFAPRIVVEERAIADQADQVVPFYINKTYHEWSTMLRSLADKENSTFVETSVRTTTIGDLFQRHGVPYYLKIDIEAMDMKVIEQLRVLEARPRYVSIEIGPDVRFVDALVQLGYDRCQLVNQERHGEILLKKKPREGRFISHTFERGSSGPFGDDLPGRWMSRDEATSEWSRQIASKFPEGAWFDLHARRDIPLVHRFADRLIQRYWFLRNR
jgi:FkbM family methyltransferase